jgi:aminopeptidase N
MLSKYVGEEKFLKGVSNYLKKKLFANSVTKDLWEGIGGATGVSSFTRCLYLACFKGLS